MDFKTRLKKTGAALARFAKAVNKFITPPEKRDAQLAQAIATQNIAKIESLIKDGARLTLDGFGATQPLSRALETQNRQIVQILLNAGADPNGKSDYGSITPFLQAARLGDRAAVLAMLDAPVKANIDAQDGRGNTALAIAVARRDAALADALIDRGAGLEVRNRDRWTPLFHAVSRGDIPMIQKLLDKGARTDLRDGGGLGIVDVALSTEKPAVYKTVQDFIDSKVPEWQVKGEDTIAHVNILREAGYRLTEIFNFKTERYAVITHNFETGRDDTVVKTFAEMEKDQTLAQARAKRAALKEEQPQPKPKAQTATGR
jgi:hypothetical protein